MASRRNKRNLIPPYCELCGYSTHVTKHRIKPGRQGGKYILGNVIGVCPNHHAECELGLFSQLELFEIVRERLRYHQALRVRAQDVQ